jgi:hypothetical protein
MGAAAVQVHSWQQQSDQGNQSGMLTRPTQVVLVRSDVVILHPVLEFTCTAPSCMLQLSARAPANKVRYDAGVASVVAVAVTNTHHACCQHTTAECHAVLQLLAGAHAHQDTPEWLLVVGCCCCGICCRLLLQRLVWDELEVVVEALDVCHAKHQPVQACQVCADVAGPATILECPGDGVVPAGCSRRDTCRHKTNR